MLRFRKAMLLIGQELPDSQSAKCAAVSWLQSSKLDGVILVVGASVGRAVSYRNLATDESDSGDVSGPTDHPFALVVVQYAETELSVFEKNLGQHVATAVGDGWYHWLDTSQEEIISIEVASWDPNVDPAWELAKDWLAEAKPEGSTLIISIGSQTAQGVWDEDPTDLRLLCIRAVSTSEETRQLLRGRFADFLCDEIEKISGPLPVSE